MKVAIILDKNQKNYEPKKINMIELTERPSYLSTVISNHQTQIHTNHHNQEFIANAPSFDLDSIKKQQYYDNLNSNHQNNNQMDFSYNVMNKPLINSRINNNNQLLFHHDTYFNPNPHLNMNSNYPQNVIPHDIHGLNHVIPPHPQISNPHYNINLNYRGDVTQNRGYTLPNLNQIDQKMKNIDHLNKLEIKSLIQDLKGNKNILESSNKQIYNSINRYGNQINVILDSLRDEMRETENELKSMVVDGTPEEKPFIIKELEDQYTKSLNGYRIDKNNYAHLKNIDPKELLDVSNAVKSSLNSNNDFYLHNDYDLIR